MERSFVFVKIVIRHIYECEQKKEKGRYQLQLVTPIVKLTNFSITQGELIMNTFTIEFKDPKDLAKKIAEYNELMNPRSIEELAAKLAEEPKKEVKPEPKKEPAPKVVEETKPEPVEVKEKSTDEVTNVPVTNFEGEPVEVKAEEVEESAENELDVDTAEVDPQVYWNDFKDWLKYVGAEGVKAALEVFRNHGVNGKPNSGDLTPEIMQELNALMGK